MATTQSKASSLPEADKKALESSRSKVQLLEEHASKLERLKKAEEKEITGLSLRKDEILIELPTLEEKSKLANIRLEGLVASEKEAGDRLSVVQIEEKKVKTSLEKLEKEIIEKHTSLEGVRGRILSEEEEISKKREQLDSDVVSFESRKAHVVDLIKTI